MKTIVVVLVLHLELYGMKEVENTLLIGGQILCN